MRHRNKLNETWQYTPTNCINHSYVFSLITFCFLVLVYKLNFFFPLIGPLWFVITIVCVPPDTKQLQTSRGDILWTCGGFTMLAIFQFRILRSFIFLCSSSNHHCDQLQLLDLLIFSDSNSDLLEMVSPSSRRSSYFSFSLRGVL